MKSFIVKVVLGACFALVSFSAKAQQVAKIGSTEYGTLADAVAAVPTDGTATTITMLADHDVTAALTVANTKNITLDLNGKTVKNAASKSLAQLITVNGKLTIDDSSADKDGKIKNTASKTYVIKTGTTAAVLTLNNGTIETTTGNSNGAVYGTSGAFVMTGGKVIAAGTGVTSKNVSISGGQITATAGQALCAAGTITGGTFTSANNNAVYANQSGTLEITGGEYTGVSTKPTINIYTTDVKVTGVTLNNGVGFASNATAMVLPGSDDTYLASTHAAFYDGETLVGYAPINTGLFASSKVSGKTVKLTKDVATTTNLNVTKSFTLDLNNHNITCTPAKDDAAILTKGTTSAPVELTIKGEGKVSCGDHGEGCNAIQVGNCTTLNIEGGEFEVPGDNSTIYIITTANTEAAKSIVKISGGKFESGDGKYVLNINDDVRAYNTFNVTGGTFVGFNPADNNAEGEHTNFTAEGYCVTNVDNEYTVVECNHVAVIGDKHYETLAAAVAAVPADGTATTITMLADVELTATVATTYGQNVILDLNGKNITSTVIAIKNLGDLEVTGTGNITVNGTKNTLYGINNAGAAGKKANLTIGENVTVTAPCVAVYTSYGKTTVNGTLANTQADASNIYSTLRQNQTSSEVIVAENAKVTGVVNAIFGDKGILEVNSTNVGKIYADGSATQGLKIKKTTAIEGLNVYGHAEFSDNADYYVAAKALSACTGTVKLLSDINAALALIAGKTVTLDLNGHKVSAETYPIKVEGDLTITGEGTVQSTGMGSSSSVQAATYVLNNGKLTILSGNYVAGYEGAEGNPAVYVRDNAVVEIKGGYFVGGSKFLLNKLDSSRETSTIEVTGGTFQSFNPADNPAEGEHTNFVAEGYKAVDNGDGTWTVVERERVAQIEEDKYLTLAEAVEAATSGQTINIINDAEVTAAIEITKNVTIALNGKTLTNNVQSNRMFRLGAATLTIDGTTEGSKIITPESNKRSFGFVDLRDASNEASAAAKLVINGGYFEGTTLDGSFIKAREDYQTVELNNVRFVCTAGDGATYDGFVNGVNNSVVNAYGLYINLTVNGGEYSYTTRGADDVANVFQGYSAEESSTITFDGVKVVTDRGPIFENWGDNSVTIKDCDFTITSTSDSYLNSTLCVSEGYEVNVNGGKYSAPYAAYVYSTGGTINIADGEFAATKALLKADVASSSVSATINVTGGIFTYSGTDASKAFQTNGSTAKIVITGGKFSVNPAKYVADGYAPYACQVDGKTYYEVKLKEAAMLSVTAKNGDEFFYSNEDDAIVLQDAGVAKVDILPDEAPNAVKSCDVTFVRTFNTTNFQAWCAPFEIPFADIPEGVHFGKVISMRINAGNQLEGMGYHLVDGGEYASVEPNTPYIVYVDEPGTYTFTGSYVKRPYTLVVGNRNDYVDYGKYRFQFFYNYESTVMVDQNALFISAGALSYTKNSTLKLAPYRFYISIYREVLEGEQGNYNSSYYVVAPETFFQSNSVANSTRMFLYDVDNPGMTTGIDIPMHHHDEPVGVGSRQTGSYDLSGRTVTKTTKGLYIENGKKIIVK